MHKNVLLPKTLPQKRLDIQLKIKKISKLRPTSSKNQLLLDVSVLIKKDAGTGIQRVVKSILKEMFENPLEGYSIVPIYCTKKERYRYVESEFIRKFCDSEETVPSGLVKVQNGDIFFGLDLNPYFLKYNTDQLFEWKLKKVEMHFLVYDLLPYLHPRWFRKKSVKNYKRWLEIVSVYSNSLICISNCVKNEMRTWLMLQGFSKHTPKISVVPIGMEIDNDAVNAYNENIDTVQELADKKYLLMVGTIEPRKGYGEVITAIQKFWLHDEEVSLVIVGHKGWKTKELQNKLLALDKFSDQLYWFSDLDDTNLQSLYKNAYGVLVASYAEGYGLPISEAIHYNKPLLVRDIPVFREVLGSYPRVMLFQDNLEKAIKDFLHTCWTSNEEEQSLSSVHSWKDSVFCLYDLFQVKHKYLSYNFR